MQMISRTYSRPNISLTPPMSMQLKQRGLPKASFDRVLLDAPCSALGTYLQFSVGQQCGFRG